MNFNSDINDGNSLVWFRYCVTQRICRTECANFTIKSNLINRIACDNYR